jgi:glycosyltransferase involved in cell wall biosynthesis
MLPKVAIICANYNYGDYIIPAIESIVNQTYEGELRLYVVDDGSSDDSWDKICGYINRYSHPTEGQDKIYAKRIENSGASVARNTAIEMCWDWADIIGVLDADDEYKPTKVEKFVNKLVEHDEIGVVYGDYDIHKSYGAAPFIKHEFKPQYSRDDLLNRCIVHSNSLIKKKYLEAVRLPNGEFYDSRLHGPASKGFIGCTEDYDLWIRLSQHCIMCHVPESLSIVNETGQNQSMKMTTEIFNQNAQILRSRS